MRRGDRLSASLSPEALSGTPDEDGEQTGPEMVKDPSLVAHLLSDPE
jgi:hypothetical protein